MTQLLMFLYFPFSLCFLQLKLELAQCHHAFTVANSINRRRPHQCSKQSFCSLLRKVKTNSRSATLRKATFENDSPMERSPLPVMPSQTFFDLLLNQFELLTNSLSYYESSISPTKQRDHEESKIGSIALYLPQENSQTGQLEFVPSSVYPSHPKSERVFIASDASSGLPPTIPPTLTQLPGFQHAQTIIPTYPFASNSGSTSAVVGTPEEVLCDRRLGAQTGSATSTALSLPLYSGPRTIGVLLVWGKKSKNYCREGDEGDHKSIWTDKDIAQIMRTGETIALALNMDADRHQSRLQTEEFRVAIADNLHQVKNPVQALRTFTKLLQRNMATDGGYNVNLGRIIDDMAVQSDRIAQNLMPIDHMIESMDSYEGKTPMERLLTSKNGQSYTDTNAENVKVVWMPTSSYLVQLSPENRPPKRRLRRVYSSEENGLQIAFIPDVLKPIISSHEGLAKACGIGFEIDEIESEELPGVTVHPKSLQEAVANIIDNSIKYVPLGYDGTWGRENPNPLVKIGLKPNDQTERRGVTITIEDNGPGIPLSEQSAVFERGFRGQSAKGVTNGSGIGLDYSRLMIEKMGGEIFLMSGRDCSGTKVKVVLYHKTLMR